jgi:transposase
MTNQELARGAARRLAIIRHAQEVSGNVAGTCRYYGISRQTYYAWLRRYEAGGVEALRDRSRRPHVSPNATKAELVGKIVYLRRSYHFGPHKIARYLKRYHDIAISPSGVWRILKRLDMNRLPYEKPLLGHRVQIDVKFIAPLPGSRGSTTQRPLFGLVVGVARRSRPPRGANRGHERRGTSRSGAGRAAAGGSRTGGHTGRTSDLGAPQGVRKEAPRRTTPGQPARRLP